MKTGVFLARMQPLHKGHMHIIEKMIEECDEVLIVIGSADKKGTIRNPLEIDFRESILKNWVFGFDMFKKYNRKLMKVSIATLNDFTYEDDILSNKEWGRYLYYNIISKISQKEFSLYYSDDIKIIQDWFDWDLSNKISIRHIDRSCVLDGISATKIREAIVSNDKEYVNKYCIFDNGTYNILEKEIKKIYNTEE